MGRHKPHKHGEILALDCNFIPMSEISRRHSLKAIFSGRAQVIDLSTYTRYEGMDALKVKIQAIIFPSVKAMNEVKLSIGKSSMGIFRRDNYTCQYCGKSGHTLDHVIPKCQGGSSSWMNLTTACWDCNQRKGGRTPQEAGMVLLKKPTSPRAILYERLHNLTSSKIDYDIPDRVRQLIEKAS